MNICAQISININISAQIGLQEFLRLFLNHRPARGEDTAQLEKVFKVQFSFLENTKRADIQVIGKEQIEDPSEVPTISRFAIINIVTTIIIIIAMNININIEDPSEVPTISRFLELKK